MNKKNINKYRQIILALLFLWGFLYPSMINAKDIEKKNILVLHSYHPAMTWEKNIDRAINNILDVKNSNYLLYTEYMDTKRHHSKKYYERLKKLYQTKYKNKHIDMILASDNNAFNFLIKNRNELFGDVPVIFSGVNGFDPKMLKNTTNFAGVAEQFSVKDTVDTILKIHPNLKQIYIINDYLETGLAWKKDIKKALQGYDKKIKLIYSDNLSLNALKEKIDSFDNDTAILMGVYFADKDKNSITYEKVGTYLLGDSKAPVYCLLNFNISNNVIGGKVIGGYTQGEAMSKIALRVFNGVDINKIPINYSQNNAYIFNYNGLKHYHIDEALLPKGSKIINKPYSLYEDYKTILFSMIALFIILLIILIIFVIYYKTNKNREKSIITFIYLSPIVFIPLVALFVSSILIYNANKNYKDINKHEKELYIEQAKSEAKNSVDQFIEMAQATLSIKEYKNRDDLEKNLLKIASKMKYKNSYLMIGSLKDGQNGIVLYHPNKDLVNANLNESRFEKVRKVFMLFKDIIDRQGQGFVKYKWNNPHSQKIEEKITYVRELPQLSWYIAMGVYTDELNQYIEKKTTINRAYDKNNLRMIAFFTVLLLIITMAISIGLSIFLKKIFKEYRKNIIAEEKKNKTIEASKKTFEKLATTDSLTKTHNRFSIMNIIGNELVAMKNKNTHFSMLMFDLDHFKNVNDTYGHDIGDVVLKEISNIVKNSLRDNDEVGRYGGEEFFITLPQTDLKIAIAIAERIRENIEKFDFPVVKHVTISIGVVEANSSETKEELLKRLDTLLYKSKNEGRNRVSSTLPPIN